jgi:putative phosphoribosyl transferase
MAIRTEPHLDRAPALRLREVHIPADSTAKERTVLEGDLALPPAPRGLVIFAHGSGSSRHSRRNRYVASELQRAGFATLLLDLLTLDEERDDARTGRWRFDIGLLARRVDAAIRWAHTDEDLRALPLALFGASTGAAAALRASAIHPEVAAIVSRGGRPDLAGAALHAVHAPTLLLVGAADEAVLELNADAKAAIAGAPVELRIVPRAGHLFEEPGALEIVAREAARFLGQHLGEGSRREAGR